MRAGAPHLTRLLSFVALILVWHLGASLADTRVLPTPAAVLVELQGELIAGELLGHLGATLARVAVSFAIAMTVGAALGLVMGQSVAADRWLDAWLVLALNLPALVTIILCYVWLGLTEAAAILAVVANKVPNVTATVREGARALDRDYFEMASAFRFSAWRRLRHIILPQLAPYLLAAARSGLAIIWKIVLVVELLGRSNGVGFKLHVFFQLFDIEGIFTYTLAFILVMVAVDLGILKPLELRANRWRR